MKQEIEIMKNSTTASPRSTKDKDKEKEKVSRDFVNRPLFMDDAFPSYFPRLAWSIDVV